MQKDYLHNNFEIINIHDELWVNHWKNKQWKKPEEKHCKTINIPS